MIIKRVDSCQFYVVRVRIRLFWFDTFSISQLETIFEVPTLLQCKTMCLFFSSCFLRFTLLKKNYASVINSFVILYCYLLNMGCLWWSLYAENFFHKLFIYLFFYISFNFHFLLLIKLQYFFLPRVVLFLLHFLFVSHYRQYTHVK